MGVSLVDIGYEDGLPAVLGDWLVKIDEIVRDREAAASAETMQRSTGGAIARAFGATS